MADHYEEQREQFQKECKTARLNETQKIFKILEEERGFRLADYEERGYSNSTIRNYRKGRTTIRLDEVKILADSMGFDYRELMRRYIEHAH